MTTTPNPEDPTDETADPGSVPEDAPGVELGAGREASSFEPEEDPEAQS